MEHQHLDLEDLHFATIRKSDLPDESIPTLDASPSSAVPCPFTFEHNYPAPSSISSQPPCLLRSMPYSCAS